MAGLDTKKPRQKMTGLLLLLRAGYGRELLIVLKVLPILGPSKRMTAITTIATSARMIAYSTRPWPFSLGANNMVEILSNVKFTPEDRPQFCCSTVCGFWSKIQSPRRTIHLIDC